MDEHFSQDLDSLSAGVEYEGLSEKFQAFLARASSCRPIFSSQPSHSLSQMTSSSSAASRSSPPKSQLIVLEDLPNILHPATQASFHAALESFIASPEGSVAPLVIIISDAGLRGEGEDDNARWKSRGKEAMDVRNVLPPSLLHSPFVTQIRYISCYSSIICTLRLDLKFQSHSIHLYA